MKQEFTLKELVRKYGSNAQKESLKNKGNLSGKEFSILMKSVEQEWESYTVEGRGSKRVITCKGKRAKKAARIDKRSNNGQGQLIGEFELNSLVVNYLIQNDNKVKPMSATKWLIELEIVDGKLTDALYGNRDIYLEKIQEQCSKMIKDYNKVELDSDMLEEFLQTALKHLKSSLVSVFNKLSRAEVITYRKEPWCCTTTSKYRKLKRKEIKVIADIRSALLLSHGLEARDLFKTNMKEVKDFKEEFDKQLQEQLGLKFYYDAHFCVIQDSNLGVHDYLHSLREKGVLDFAIGLTDEDAAFTMTQVYKDKYSKHSLKLAKGREQNITNTSDSDRVKCLKIMKQYALIWELLLRYFKCTSCLKSNPFAVELEAPETREQTKKERINQQQTKQSLKEIGSKIREQQGSTVVAKPIVEPSNQYTVEKYYDYEYLAAMEEIRDEIREYEEKHGDEAMEHIALDSVIREFTKEITAEETVADEFKHQWQYEVGQLKFHDVEEYYDCEYLAAMEEIRDEIREYEEYEEEYGDEAMKYIALHRAMRMFLREVTAEESIPESKHQWKSEKERENEEWEKMFNRWQPVKREQITDSSVKAFYKIVDCGRGHNS